MSLDIIRFRVIFFKNIIVLRRYVLPFGCDVWRHTTSLLILAIGICKTIQAACYCDVSTAFRNAFPVCLTDSFKSMSPFLASLHAQFIMILIPFCILLHKIICSVPLYTDQRLVLYHDLLARNVSSSSCSYLS